MSAHGMFFVHLFQQVNKMLKEKTPMRLKALMNDIWVRTKNLHPSNPIDKKNKIPDNKAG